MPAVTVISRVAKMMSQILVIKRVRVLEGGRTLLANFSGSTPRVFGRYVPGRCVVIWSIWSGNRVLNLLVNEITDILHAKDRKNQTTTEILLNLIKPVR